MTAANWEQTLLVEYLGTSIPKIDPRIAISVELGYTQLTETTP